MAWVIGSIAARAMFAPENLIHYIEHDGLVQVKLRVARSARRRDRALRRFPIVAVAVRLRPFPTFSRIETFISF